MNRLTAKLKAVLEALISATKLNIAMLCAKLTGCTTLVVQVSSATQLMHVEPLLEVLLSRSSANRLRFWVLTNPNEFSALDKCLNRLPGPFGIGSHRAARLLIACDFMLCLDQGAMYPWVGCKVRACSFHGQPSKGNVYQRFNHRQINTLFFYGPLMRDYFLKTKAAHPEWPEMRLYDVGQPLTDRRFNNLIDKAEARQQLGLDPTHFTIIYAPSFEYCSSLATDGIDIIKVLLSAGLNVIVKPHPAFYKSAPFDDEFNRECPHSAEWSEKIACFSSFNKLIFPLDNSLDGDLALVAADVMLTDYSGIAFDGIALDQGMIYWECPRFFDDYLPRRYGVDGASAKSDLTCNVGRDCGILVNNTCELGIAVDRYRQDPSYLASARQEIRKQLYFNPGYASEAMADAIEKMLFGGINDRQ